MPIVNFNQVNRQLRRVDFAMPPAKEKWLRKFCKKACQILGDIINKPEEIQAAFLAATHNKEDAEWGKSIGVLAMLSDRFVYITITEQADKAITYGFPYDLTNSYSLVDNKAGTGMASINFKHDEQNFSFVAFNGLVPVYFIAKLGEVDMKYNPKSYRGLRKFLKNIGK